MRIDTVKAADFFCTFDNTADLVRGQAGRSGVSFPDLYYDALSLAMLSENIRQLQSYPVCLLPFCYTLEAESLGAKVNYGTGLNGPRVKEHAYHNVEELENLPEFNLQNQRIKEVQKAIQLLKSQGKYVAMEISGPMSILNNLIDLSQVLKAWRKSPQQLESIFSRLVSSLLLYAQSLWQAGVDILCYADPTGSYSILGPKYSERLLQVFTVPFLKQLRADRHQEGIIQLCPKTSNAIVAFDLGYWREQTVFGYTTYAQGCLQAKGQTALVGQNCIRNHKKTPEKKIIKELILY